MVPPARIRRLARQRLVVLFVVVVALAGCRAADRVAEGEVLPATPLAADQDPGLAHVHGLGVNPADGAVLVATHFGLWRLLEDGGAERVGDAFHDLMGFHVMGADHFIASGHPLLTEELPPLLGLIETTDGGRTWRSRSLLGAADFHALRASHDAVWGWNSADGALMVSDDGRQWATRARVPAMLDFVVDPADPEHLLAAAAGPAGTGLERSTDGGRTWESLDGPALARLAWADPERLGGVDLDGVVWRSSDGGVSWQETGAVAGQPEAFVDTGDRLLVAAGGEIAQSGDRGATWTVLYRDR